MFVGLSERDFDAYAPGKWRSNAYNRERLEVKERLLDLGRALDGVLSSGEGAPLLCEASVEHPALWNHKQVDAQHLFFSRNEQARHELDRIIERGRTLASLIDDPSPQRSHVVLAVSLRVADVFVGLELHHDARVDRQNLEKQLEESWQRDNFVELVRDLPRALFIGVDGGAEIAVTALTAVTLEELLARLARPLGPTESRWLRIGARIERADAIAAGGALRDQIAATLRALLPIYRIIAWHRDNDHISIREQLRDQTTLRRQRGLTRNDQVRIVTGMFAGRAGVVQDVDSKGMLKVLVGTMQVKVRAEDVERSSR